jgi:hypothetical protein
MGKQGIQFGSGDNGSREQKRKITGELHVRGEIEANIPRAAMEQYKAAIQENTSRDNWRFAVECITLFFVIVVAILGIIQTRQSIRSAGAARDAADTNKASLHVAERAYLSISAPSYDSQKTITFQLVNTGHLAAEDVKLLVYRLAIPPTPRPGSTLYQLSDVIDFGKTELKIPSIPNMQSGLPNIISAVFDNLDPTRTGINGTELVVGGFVDYKAGFEDEARQNSSFCMRTVWELKAGRPAIASCNINDYLPLFKDLLSIREQQR